MKGNNVACLESSEVSSKILMTHKWAHKVMLTVSNSYKYTNKCDWLTVNKPIIKWAAPTSHQCFTHSAP